MDTVILVILGGVIGFLSAILASYYQHHLESKRAEEAYLKAAEITEKDGTYMFFLDSLTSDIQEELKQRDLSKLQTDTLISLLVQVHNANTALFDSSLGAIRGQ